jgi:uncharacterized protein (TIGR02145 family)
MRISKLFFLSFFILISVWSCKKDDEPGNIFNPSLPVMDIDSNVYKTVAIGTQIWMAENLKVTHFNNGDSIPNIPDSTAWKNMNSAALCNYNNDKIIVSTYGRLYNWYAVVDIRNICPFGWHIPSDNEWTSLSNYLGGNNIAGGKMKEEGIAHWSSPNIGATNETGFTALPGGSRDSGGVFKYIGSDGGWWTCTENDSISAFLWSMYYLNTRLSRKDFYKKDGFSVRCVKN